MHIRCKLFVSHIRLHREHYRFRKRKTIIHSYFYYHIFIPPTEIFSVISVSIIYHSFIFYAIFFHKKFIKCIRHVHSSSCLCLICRFTPIKNEVRRPNKENENIRKSKLRLKERKALNHLANTCSLISNMNNDDITMMKNVREKEKEKTERQREN